MHVEFDPATQCSIGIPSDQSHIETGASIRLDPEQLESQIGFLIGRYQGVRCKAMAQSIVQHMEALCSHPDYLRAESAHCAYHRTLKAWRIIAGEENAAV
jgi:hypothetical protein